MTIHLADGRDIFINFREKAPEASSANMYLDASGNVVKNASLLGYLAVGVLGRCSVDTALQKYGTLSRAQVMKPAIKLAREGFILNRGDTDILDTTVEQIRKDPEAARIFLRRDGSPLQPGDRLVQKDLARSTGGDRQARPGRLLQRQDPAGGRGSGEDRRWCASLQPILLTTPSARANR